MSFQVDERIAASSVWVTDLSLSRLYFKNDANFPWLILVPRVENASELYQLSEENRQLLIEEIAQVSKITEHYFRPDKLNVGALGNIVSQLHIHIVARFKEDKLWPHSIWQPGLAAENYEVEVLQAHVANLRERLDV
jgi:diadenosine tetraphosphate (Ap4A) HIT family hydrolase